MTLDDLSEALKPENKEASHLYPNNKQVKIELVVLGMPMSNKIA